MMDEAETAEFVTSIMRAAWAMAEQRIREEDAQLNGYRPNYRDHGVAFALRVLGDLQEEIAGE